jgi:hypothetical protein
MSPSCIKAKLSRASGVDRQAVSPLLNVRGVALCRRRIHAKFLPHMFAFVPSSFARLAQLLNEPWPPLALSEQNLRMQVTGSGDFCFWSWHGSCWQVVLPIPILFVLRQVITPKATIIGRSAILQLDATAASCHTETQSPLDWIDRERCALLLVDPFILGAKFTIVPTNVRHNMQSKTLSLSSCSLLVRTLPLSTLCHPTLPRLQMFGLMRLVRVLVSGTAEM